MPTLLSLFDGSGGFPLAGALCGITPIAASEVEPYPIAVTKSRFPDMKHLGDIGKINGAEIEPVDIITFGSPCQDLSVAGKRAGLKHANHGDAETTRSGLFIEAVRIIKEMREQTDGEYPRFAVWENVPGAFSSNRGEDFRIVLEEIIKIVEPSAVMPEVPQKGWAYADSYCGDGWSLAYRVLDAQYWGVPQRRRRIYLVADFGGQCAREILFKREGLRGYFTQGRTPWKTTTTDAQGSLGADDREGKQECSWINQASGFCPEQSAKTRGIGYEEEIAPTLRSGVTPGVAYGISAYESNAMKSSNPHSGVYEANTSRTLDLNGGNPACNQGGIAIVEPIAVATQQGGAEITDNGICPTITAAAGMSGNNQPWIAQGFDAYNQVLTGDKTVTLRAGSEHNYAPVIQQIINLNKGDVQSKTILDPNGIAPALYAGECRGGGGECYVMDKTIALEGNGQRPSHKGDGYALSKKSYTLNATEIHGVVYVVDQGGGKSQVNVSENISPTLTCTHDGAPAAAYGLDRASFNQGKNAQFDFSVMPEQQPTLTAKGPGAVCCSGLNNSHISHTLIARMDSAVGTTQDNLIVSDYSNPVRYIVRRLTPTECARLQGFADRWGDIDNKNDFTDEEYRFWLDVRNTHASINGRQTKEYTKAQMLTWYNKLLTDSAEYKMWGNGIALPCALYVMQGIEDALQRE